MLDKDDNKKAVLEYIRRNPGCLLFEIQGGLALTLTNTMELIVELSLENKISLMRTLDGTKYYAIDKE